MHWIRANTLETIGIVATVFFISMRLMLPAPIPSPTAVCGFTESDLHPDPAADAVITVWAHTVVKTCWRAFAPLLAARQIREPSISLEIHPVNYSERNYYNAMVTQAAEVARTPTIASMHSWYIDDLVRSELLQPIDECLTKHEEFDEIIPELFSIFTMDGHIWAIPIQMDMLLFFFNKPMLRELGWSEEEIEQLPMQIASGQFTLDDLVTTSRYAVATGVVDAQFAYWPIYTKMRHIIPVYKSYGGQRISKAGIMLVDKSALAQTYAFHAFLLNEGWNIPRAAGNVTLGAWPTGALWRETVANGRVLFWTGIMSHWTNWQHQAEIQNETEWLTKSVGVAPLPGANGQKGNVTIDNLNALVVFRNGTRTPKENEAICQLLATMIRPEFSRLVIQQENLLPAMDVNQHPEILQGLPLQQHVSTMLGEIDWVDFRIGVLEHFTAVVQDGLLDVERGQVSPEEAVDRVVTKLESELGDDFLARP